MDNRQLVINGKSFSHFEKALEVAFLQESEFNPTTKAFIDSETHGLILLWGAPEPLTPPVNKFLTPHVAKTAANVAWDWLLAADPDQYKLSGWDTNHDHDGSNSKGWKIYCQDWGHVGERPYAPYAICGIIPVWLWHGK